MTFLVFLYKFFCGQTALRGPLDCMRWWDFLGLSFIFQSVGSWTPDNHLMLICCSFFPWSRSCVCTQSLHLSWSGRKNNAQNHRTLFIYLECDKKFPLIIILGDLIVLHLNFDIISTEWAPQLHLIQLQKTLMLRYAYYYIPAVPRMVLARFFRLKKNYLYIY